ncbi:hypothetical protein [uncultured Bifidobacterium sp.]|uniref:DUF4190 domain-containing protein n=1 Tax=uncultured Bifidobacterium sp. TaxID=165187 RepID=UPI0028DB41BD|nr:hypothetical protein [uncultured Bifidobacterium sp.]
MTDDPEHGTPDGTPTRDDADVRHSAEPGAGRPAVPAPDGTPAPPPANRPQAPRRGSEMPGSSDRDGASDVAPVPAAPRQPEYGQVRMPEYGALASSYPSGYDPYLYGRPAPTTPTASPAPSSAPRTQGPKTAASAPAAPHRPEMFHGVDLADPGQNPLYGRWDSYAVLALVFAFVGVPVLPAVMGGISLWRTRRFHMRGFGLAVAAIVVSLLITAVDVWMVKNGISIDMLIQWATGQSSSGTSGSSISA